jgi:ketol-acid reductoisomerase
VGPTIIDRGVRKRMASALKQIQSGKFARDWAHETRTGRRRLDTLLAAAKAHPIEKVGVRLRGLMAWKRAGKQEFGDRPAGRSRQFAI